MKALFLIAFLFLCQLRAEIKDPHVLVVTEGEPACNLCDSINVLTGDFFVFQQDLVIEAVEPICLSRCYVSGDGKGKNGGWTFYPHLVMTLHYSDTIVEKEMVYVAEPNGTLITYTKDKKRGFFYFDIEKHGHGVTNTSQGEIGGRTNFKNQKIYRPGNDWMKIVCASGAERLYKKDPKTARSWNVRFLLHSEKLPHGNYIIYTYDSSNRLSKIETKSPSQNQTYAWAQFQYVDNEEKSHDFDIETSDGKRVQYRFLRIEKKKISLSYEEKIQKQKPSKYDFYLESVQSSHLPEEKFYYTPANGRRAAIVNTRTQPEGRYIRPEYYDLKHNDVGGTDVKISDDEDRRLDRVKCLFAPVGPSSEEVPIFRFFYELGKPKGNGYKTPGKTQIYDALNNQTTFQFSEMVRPQVIHRNHFCNGQQIPLNKEIFIWDGTQLRCKALLDGNSKAIRARCLSYDERGNVLEETLFGNLSGHCPAQLNIKDGGLPEANGIEGYKTTYTYNLQNLMLRREEDNGRITQFTYLPGTPLLSSRLTGTHDRIFVREFFEYDAEHILIKTIKDDGLSSDKDDMSGVTQRTYTAVTSCRAAPALGLPEVVEEGYWDKGNYVPLKKVVLAYSFLGQVIRRDVYDATGVLRYSLNTKYDSKGQVIEETDPLGRSAKSEYDDHGNKTYCEDPSGRVHARMGYDRANRPIQIEEVGFDGIRHTSSHRYNALNQKTSTIDSFGQPTEMVYDPSGKLLESSSPEVLNINLSWKHLKTKHAYDCAGNKTSSTNSENHTTTARYNIRGKPAEVSHPNGAHESFYYNLNGSLHKQVDAVGTQTVYAYDLFERPLAKKIISSSGKLLSEEKYTYNTFHLLSQTDAAGNTTLYQYDGAGRKISEEFHHGTVIERTDFSYDKLGRLRSSQTGELVSIREYDLADRIIEERQEDTQNQILSKVCYGYDSAGNQNQITRWTEQGESIEAILYDSFNRPIERVDALGKISHISYDENFINSKGQRVLQKMTVDPKGTSTIETYDTLGRIVTTQKKNAFGEELSDEEMIYDGVGNLCRQISKVIGGEETKEITTLWQYGTTNQPLALYEGYGSPNQKTSHFSYNIKGQKESVTKSDGTMVQHSYDGLGRLIELHSPNSSCHYRFEYDPLHNPVSVEDLTDHTAVLRRYDGRGRLLEEHLPQGFVFQNEYDNSGRRTRFVLPDQSEIHYSYDALHMTQVERFDASEKLLYTHRYRAYDLSGHLIQEELIGNLGRVDYDIDTMGRTVALSTPYSTQKVTYDLSGNIVRLETGSHVSEFSYDDLHQLTQERGAFNHAYQFDSHHNRLKKDDVAYALNDINQLENCTYDCHGNLLSDDDFQYEYDTLNRLVSVEKPEQFRLIYTYDGWHRRLSKTVYTWQNHAWAESSKLYFLYDGQDEIGASQNNQLIQLRILGQGKGAEIGSAIAFELHSQTYLPIYDIFGNVHKLVRFADGQVAEAYQYSAFGEEQIFDAHDQPVPTSSINNPWRFASKRTEDETHLVFFGRRYYIPSLGRWLTPDPQGFIDGPNLYAFVFNDPLAKLDLYGLEAIPQNGMYNFFAAAGNTALSMINFVGRSIWAFGFHCIPFQPLRGAILGIGHLLSGERYINDGEPKGSTSQVLSTGGEKRGDIDFAHYTGINTTKKEALAAGQLCSEKYGDSTVSVVYDGNHGFISNILECLAGLVGIPTHAVKIGVKDLQQRIARVGGIGSDGRVVLTAHSQGGLNLYRILQHLSPEEKKMIAIYTFGSAKRFDLEGFAEKSKHYLIDRDVAWWFPFAGGTRHTTILHSPKGSMFENHSFTNEIYQAELKNIGKRYSP